MRGVLAGTYPAASLSTGLTAGRLRGWFVWATLALLLYLTACGGLILVKVAAIAALILLAGLAALEMVLPGTVADVGAGTRSPVRNAFYLAVGVGPTVVLLITIALRLAGLYSFAAVLGGLAVVAASGLMLQPSLRGRLWRPGRSVDALFFIWLACALFYALIVPPQNDPFTKASSVYLLQGFDLVFNKNPSEWPYFGEKFLMPMLFVTHAIGSNMALFSTGSRFEFWLYGQHWLNVMLSPLMGIGAYLWLRRMLPGWAAAIVAALFCISLFDARIWSIRGESLGWIFGFPFLLGLDDLLRYLRAGRGMRPAFRLAAVLGALYLAVTLTHGVVAMIVTFVATGMCAHHLGICRGWRSWLAMARTGVPFTVALAVLTAAYIPAFSGFHSKLLSNDDRVPVAGEPDAALLFENAIDGFPERTVDRVRTAPYLPYADGFGLAAYLPLASLTRPALARLTIAHFYEDARAALARVTPAERLFYLALLLGWGLLYLFRREFALEGRHAGLFVICTVVYLLLVLFSGYMNAVSESSFPVAAVRRTFGYVKFFYFLAVATAALDFVVLPLARPLAAARTVRRVLPAAVWRDKLARWGAAAILLWLLSTSLYTNAANLSTAANWWWIEWRLQQLAITAVNRITPAVAIDDNVSVLFYMRKLLFGPAAEPAFAGAFRYIRQHVPRGAWVYSNIISDNQFWYLTNGRYSLAEGSAMYQVYSLQARAAAHLQRFAKLAETANLDQVKGYAVDYFLLFKGTECSASCYGYGVYTANQATFDARPDLTKAYEDQNYVIYRRAAPNATAKAAAVASPPAAASDNAATPAMPRAPGSDLRGVAGWVESIVFRDGRYEVDGWLKPVAGIGPVTLAVYVEGKPIAVSQRRLPRPDLARVLGSTSEDAGFHLSIDASLLATKEARRNVRFYARAEGGQLQQIDRDELRSLLPAPFSDPYLTELSSPVPPTPEQWRELQAARQQSMLMLNATGVGLAPLIPADALTPAIRFKAPPVTNTNRIEGWIGVAKLVGNDYQIWGWAVDPSLPHRLTIEVYLGDRLLGVSDTWLPRLDVARSFAKEVGTPGIALFIPGEAIPPSKRGEVRFFATGDGLARELPCNPKQCVFPPPSNHKPPDKAPTAEQVAVQHAEFADLAPAAAGAVAPKPDTTRLLGWVEGATLNLDDYDVYGWVFDPQTTSQPGMRVGVYVGDKLIGSAPVNRPRPDVDQYLGHHVGPVGFKFRFLKSALADGDATKVHFIARLPNGAAQELLCNPKICVFNPYKTAK